MPQPHASSDVGLKKHSFASASEHRILTDVEVAERLGVSRFTVRSWRLKGVGPRFLKMGRAVRYRSQDVDEYERQALVETQASHDHSPM
jgi:excisionase family DNA binding protein